MTMPRQIQVVQREDRSKLLRKFRVTPDRAALAVARQMTQTSLGDGLPQLATSAFLKYALALQK